MKIEIKYLKIMFLLTGALLCGIQISAQTYTLRNSMLGSSATSITLSDGQNTYFVQQTLGQTSFGGTVKAEGLKIGQGFVQPLVGKSVLSSESQKLAAETFPNPVVNTLIINIEDKDINQFRAVITDMTGRTVYDNFFGKKDVSIDLQHLPTGMYILTLSSETKSSSSNLIKL